MSTQVTLILPDDLYRRAEHLAQLTGRTVTDVLIEMLESTLSLLEAAPPPDVSLLSNMELLALAQVEMNIEQSQRLNELQARRQSGTITVSERFELLGLTQVLYETHLRKIAAQEEAVRRGLTTST